MENLRNYWAALKIANETVLKFYKILYVIQNFIFSNFRTIDPFRTPAIFVGQNYSSEKCSSSPKYFVTLFRHVVLSDNVSTVRTIGLSDYRPFGLSTIRTIDLSDYRPFGLSPWTLRDNRTTMQQVMKVKLLIILFF